VGITKCSTFNVQRQNPRTSNMQEAIIQQYDDRRIVKVLTCLIYDAVERFEVEQRVYERLSPHPRVIRYHGMTSDIGPAGGIVLDMAINGSVLDYLTEHPNTPRDIRNRWCLQVAEALVHLHSNDVIWSDGNPANVLLDEKLHSFISDFGGSSIDGSLASAFGPPGYSRLDGTRTPPSFHADIFSFGSIVFYILSGSHPDEESTLPSLPANIGSSFGKIIRKCWKGGYETTSQLRNDVEEAAIMSDSPLPNVLCRVSNHFL
jgi:serine/threonine protein kinase